ncbi:MAG: hypothetical protein ACRCX2_14660, partial [Paraclostridium sp.]
KEVFKNKMASKVIDGYRGKQSDVYKSLINAGSIFKAEELLETEFIEKSAVLIDTLRMKNTECIKETLENLGLIENEVHEDAVDIEKFAKYLEDSRYYSTNEPSDELVEIIAKDIFYNKPACYKVGGKFLKGGGLGYDMQNSKEVFCNKIVNNSNINLFVDKNMHELIDVIKAAISKNYKVVAAWKVGYDIKVFIDIEVHEKPNLFKRLFGIKSNHMLSKAGIQFTVAVNMDN